MQNNVEILAPAGNYEMMYAAVQAGANAVYLGLEQFSARRTAGNFTIDALKQAVVFCHARNVRVYVAINTTIYDGELLSLASTIKQIANAGIDAVIVQDLAVARLVFTMASSLAVHGSTQMSVHSLEGAKKLQQLGFSRVILSRELSLAEIEHITKNCTIETEVFVHGALCVSVSGQCYMSAFLGGRSGNRGACAGTCRLPFEANGCENAPSESCFHLSLKDMSHISQLPSLAKVGVASVKIEGRLRTQEYAAAAVNACVKALNKEIYDKQLLQDVFSRSGFTDSYLNGVVDGKMFGVRTAENTSAAKEAEPKIRELFRREMPRVALDIEVDIDEDGAALKVSDGKNSVYAQSNQTQLSRAQKPQGEAIEKALSKTGGTPFYTNSIKISDVNWFLPAGEWNEMRRQALEELLLVRSKVKGHNSLEVDSPLVRNILKVQAKDSSQQKANKKLFVQVDNVAQLENLLTVGNAEDMPEGILIPIEKYEQIAPSLQSKAWLVLPRFCGAVNDESKLIALVQKTKALNKFAGYVVQNIAHIKMCEGSAMLGSFGLNVTNRVSAQEYEKMGVSIVTLSVELMSQQIAQIASSTCVQTAAIVYGHMPVMMTRSCPLQNTQNCQTCKGEGTLLDRKGKSFFVKCSNKGAKGVRTIYNPIPIYMGDKTHELPVDVLIAQFSVESPKEVAEIVATIKQKQAYTKDFTRGLYFKGTNFG